MNDWIDDTALGLIAENLGQKVVEMYDSCGMPIPTTYLDPQGSPSPDVQQTVISMFILDAEDFTGPDPQKLLDEYQRMQRAAIDCGSENNRTHGPLEYAHSRICDWHGDAAQAFANQVTSIEDFMKQQQDSLAYAMQAMGTAFGLAVQVRQSYFDMAENMIEACRTVIAKHPNEPSVTSTMIAMGKEIVSVGTGAMGAKETKDLLKLGAETFKEAFSDLKEKAPIDSSDAAKVLGSYLGARNKLRSSVEDGLSQLATWLDGQRSAYFSLPVPILEPMPACTDARGPDFSYGKFFSDYHDPDTYSPKVEQERRKLAEEHPEGPIHRRLRGEE